MELNESQKKAVESKAENLLVVAGAGSGKTQTMTRRIARIIQAGESPSSILALTFTRKAANEMKERLSKMVDASKVRMGTFHAVGLSILQKWGEKIGYKTTEGKRISVLSADDADSLMKTVMEEYGIRTIKKTEFHREMVKLSHSGKEPENPDHKRIIQEYWNRLKENNSVDFDLILLECQKLLGIPEVAEYYRNRWKWVFVDEYQDTDQIQYNLHDLIGPENLMVIGDSDQAIYSWRGADLRIILSFKEKKNAEVVYLNECYRCPENVVESTNRLIAHNKGRLEKALFPLNPPGKIEVKQGAVESVARFLSEELAFENPENVAVLARTHFTLQTLQACAEGFGVPVHRVGESTDIVGKNPVWKNFLALLKSIHNPFDNISFYPVLGLLGISAEDRKGIGLAAREKGLSIQTILKTTAPGNRFEVFKRFYAEGAVKDLRETWADYREFFKTPIIPEVETYLAETVPVGINASEFLEWYQTKDLHAELEKKKPGKMTFCTAHAAKGLEWDTVVITRFDEGVFPNRGNEEEERRLAYVAMTRARKNLFIFWETEPSKFIQEAGLCISRKGS